MAFPGEWLEDSEPFWAPATGAGIWQQNVNTGPHNTIWQSVTTSQTVPPGPGNVVESAMTVWNGSGDGILSQEFGPYPHTSGLDLRFDQEVVTSGAVATQAESVWTTAWAILQRPDGGSLAGFISGIIPDSLLDPETGEFADPNVVGIEWEPSPEPIDQRLWIRSNYQDQTHTPALLADEFEQFSFHLWSASVTGTVDPAPDPGEHTPPGGIGAKPRIGTTAASGDEVTYYALPGSPTDGMRVLVVPVDHASANLTPYEMLTDLGDAAGVRLDFQMQLQQQYRPRYRLLYAELPEPEPTGKPFRRVWPREHGRVWPPPRHQHGRRTHGGYL